MTMIYPLPSAPVASSLSSALAAHGPAAPLATRLHAGVSAVSGAPRSLDERLAETVGSAGESIGHLIATMQTLVPQRDAFDDTDDLISLQTVLSDFSIRLAFQSAMARKGVNAVETLLKS